MPKRFVYYKAILGFLIFLATGITGARLDGPDSRQFTAIACNPGNCQFLSNRDHPPLPSLESLDFCF